MYYIIFKASTIFKNLNRVFQTAPEFWYFIDCDAFLILISRDASLNEISGQDKMDSTIEEL